MSFDGKSAAGWRRVGGVLTLVTLAMWASSGTAAGSDGSLDPSGLPPMTDAIDGTAAESDTVVAGGSQLLALDVERRTALRRWVRRGGRLLVVGDDSRAAVEALVPVSVRSIDRPIAVGLGQVLLGTDARLMQEPAPRSSTALLDAAAALARAGLPEPAAGRRATAKRLAAFATLLVIGFAVTGGRRRRWRRAGAVVLVMLFASWPLWGGRVASNADELRQVDVVLDTADGPSIVWSAVALAAERRHDLMLETAGDAWRLGVAQTAGSVAVEPRESTAAPGFRIETAGGARAAVTWLSETAGESPLALEIDRREQRLTGLVRNGLDHPLEDAWLLWPGSAPQRLDGVAASAALLVDMPAPPALERSLASSMTLDLDLRRGRLLEATLERAIRPLLRRDWPVMVAWSRAPAGAASIDGAPLQSGWTLIVTVVETAS